MTDFCPHCPHCNPELAVGLPEPNNVASDLVALRAECRIRGISVSWDGFVATADAAKLVRKSSSTLSNWRDQGRGPSYRKASGRSGHCEYSLAELAAFRSESFDGLAN